MLVSEHHEAAYVAGVRNVRVFVQLLLTAINRIFIGLRQVVVTFTVPRVWRIHDCHREVGGFNRCGRGIDANADRGRRVQTELVESLKQLQRAKPTVPFLVNTQPQAV